MAENDLLMILEQINGRAQQVPMSSDAVYFALTNQSYKFKVQWILIYNRCNYNSHLVSTSTYPAHVLVLILISNVFLALPIQLSILLYV